MLLSVLIKKGGLESLRVATFATVATQGGWRFQTVAPVARIARRAFDRDEFEERAAIMEYDGDLSREEAEWRAARSQGYDLATVRRLH